MNPFKKFTISCNKCKDYDTKIGYSYFENRIVITCNNCGESEFH